MALVVRRRVFWRCGKELTAVGARTGRGESLTCAIFFSRSYCGRTWWKKKTTWWSSNAFRQPIILTSFAAAPFVTKVSKKNLCTPALLPTSAPVEISRLMLPDDTNVAGNVHGGTILKMLEMAGHVVASRHCNKDRTDSDSPITTALVRLEKMDFLQPMHVGEVAQVQAAITYTSAHSLEVTVDVWAENVFTGERRHTNSARLWYVGVTATPEIFNKSKLQEYMVAIPPLLGLSRAETEAGKKRYEAQKSARISGVSTSEGEETPVHVYHYPKEGERGTVRDSQTTLASLVLPSDCIVTGHMMGGALMKMMDNAGGICASRYCRGRTVTVGIDVINFHQPISNGEIVFVTARVVFTSTKSMEIEVTTEAEGYGGRRITNTAYFTFVCLGEDGKVSSVTPLNCTSEEEKRRFDEGKKRYFARKEERTKNK